VKAVRNAVAMASRMAGNRMMERLETEMRPQQAPMAQKTTSQS
jgi:hypothetical protein